MQLNRGFSLVELAVVIFIMGLLLSGAMLTLSAQEEQRANAETRRRLEAAVDAVLAFALVNRRLPCPADGLTGNESLASGTPATGGPCVHNFRGFLPGRTIGFAPLDAQGFAVDAWGNRIRYAVASAVVGGASCPSGTPHFTSQANLKANGVGCQPNDLVICQASAGTSPGASPPTCNTAQPVTNQQTVAFLVLSTGKNGRDVAAAQSADELSNTNGDAIFISREHGTLQTTTGSFDDMLIWVPAGVLYSRLLAGGVLP